MIPGDHLKAQGPLLLHAMFDVDQLYIPQFCHSVTYSFAFRLTNVYIPNSGTKPMCTSNTSLTRVLVENDCDLEPDHVELNCSVAYRGNIPPLLEWHHSLQSDVEMERYVVNRRTSAVNSVAIALHDREAGLEVQRIELRMFVEGCERRKWV